MHHKPLSDTKSDIKYVFSQFFNKEKGAAQYQF